MSDSRTIEEAAASWLIRREEAGWSAIDEAALVAWLDQSMAHKAAFWRLEHGWRQADRIGALGDRSRPRSDPTSAPAPEWHWGRALAIAASLAALIGIALMLALHADLMPGAGQETPRTQFETDVGGRRVIALADGSRVELNTATVVRAAVNAERREFWLDRGEAYFDVARIENRPFIVHAGPRTVTVLGTKFSVRRDGERVTVSVLEGRVRVEDAAAGRTQRSTTIAAGDVAIAHGASTLVAADSAARVETQLAWREGMLVFDQSTLAEAAAEFNRYNRRQIVIGDSEAAAIRIGGSFQASNVDAFARLLRDAYGLDVEVRDDQVMVSN